MSMFLDLIEESRHHLMTAQPDTVNVLDGNINDTVDTVTLRHQPKGVSEGSTLCIGLEEMYVLSLTTTGTTTDATVIRHMNGSTAAAHVAGDLVYVNPHFSPFRIGKYVNQGINNLSAEGLFRIRNTTLTANAVTFSYDLNSLDDFIEVWKVRYDTVGPSNEWPYLRRDEYWIDLGANLTEFPSGRALFLRQTIESGRTIQISYKSGFDPLVNLTDDVVSVSGLHSQAHDLPSLYAAICLLSGRDVKRSFLHSQPEPRRQEEVPPGAASQAMRPLIERYYTRIEREQIRLKKLYPQQI